MKLFKYSSIVLLTFFLFGCVGAFTDSSESQGFTSYDKRSLKTTADDQAITQHAEMKLYGDRTIDENAHIIVASFNYNVLLAGQAPTPELRTKATDLVQSIPKIKRIYNEITISQPTSAFTRSQDAWTTAKVKATLMTRAGLDTTKIKVITENGVVYLLGIVTHAQADRAVAVARQVTGVKRVVKLFEYSH